MVTENFTESLPNFMDKMKDSEMADGCWAQWSLKHPGGTSPLVGHVAFLYFKGK